MKKYTVLDYDFNISGTVIASSAQYALIAAKITYPHVIAPMVYEATK